MRISTEIASAAKHVGEEAAIELIAKAGFDAYDLSMFRMTSWNWMTKELSESDHPFGGKDYAAFARRLRHVADECGIVCNQSHAPFPSFGEPMIPYLLRAIECTAIAGGTVCVIHPNNNHSAEENALLYERLLPFAKECGVKIATENMWNWDREREEALPAACSHHEDFLRHIEAVNDPDFVACLDIGHAAMRGLSTSVEEMIGALAPHLAALHVHDNDLHHDSHQIPFSMGIDWDGFIKALARADYRGDMTLEADRYLANRTPDTLLDGIRSMKDAADRLRSAFLAERAALAKK